MLKYIILSSTYKIDIIDKVEENDLEVLSELLKKKGYLFEINFINLYTIPPSCIDMIYHYQYELQQNIKLTTNKGQLSKYLHNLGFTIFFHPDKRYTIHLDIDVIAIGGSANSSEKIIEILSQIELENFAVFIIQHVNPKHEGLFDTILSTYVTSKVSYAVDGMNIQKGHIYLAPSNKHLKVNNGEIVLDEEAKVHSARPSISVSFRSLSEEYKEHFLALLTCGYIDDGVDSLVTLKTNNSTIIIQKPEECHADSIPNFAKKQAIYDFIFTTKESIKYINMLHLDKDTEEAWLDILLYGIYEEYEYDYRRYYQDSIKRRVKSFMLKYSINSIKELSFLVFFNKSIFNSLFLDLSINVTDFFRKERSSQNMISLIQKEYKNCYNIKIWSAGCSSGKEVYSTAIILNELGLLHKSIIYATDINPIVIQEAKNGVYELQKYKEAEQIYKNFGFQHTLNHYFEINNYYVKVKPMLQEKVLFFVHNLAKDSVFNEFDMIECKNVMIYFDDVLKGRVFQLFYDSLKFGGHLFLGESEELLSQFQTRFKKCHDDCKIYRKIA